MTQNEDDGDAGEGWISFETRYQTYRELFLSVMDKQFHYGKWLLASLLTVHAGSLLAISQAGEARDRLYHACGPLLIYGVAATLLAGGLAWINFSIAMNAYAHVLKDLRHGKETKLSKPKVWIVNFTLWVTPTVALASLVLFFIAASRAANVI